MGTTSRRPVPLRNPQLPLWLAALANLGVALLQLLLFLPGLVEGHILDAPFPFAYRVDSLSLTFGVSWTLALAFMAATLGLEWSNIRGGSGSVALSMCLMSLGLLGLA